MIRTNESANPVRFLRKPKGPDHPIPSGLHAACKKGKSWGGIPFRRCRHPRPGAGDDGLPALHRLLRIPGAVSSLWETLPSGKRAESCHAQAAGMAGEGRASCPGLEARWAVTPRGPAGNPPWCNRPPPRGYPCRPPRPLLEGGRVSWDPHSMSGLFWTLYPPRRPSTRQVAKSGRCGGHPCRNCSPHIIRQTINVSPIGRRLDAKLREQMKICVNSMLCLMARPQIHLPNVKTYLDVVNTYSVPPVRPAPPGPGGNGRGPCSPDAAAGAGRRLQQNEPLILRKRKDRNHNVPVGPRKLTVQRTRQCRMHAMTPAPSSPIPTDQL